MTDAELDALVARLRAGHEKECAMSYGMHEHCCDCSYPDRQVAADTITALREDVRRYRFMRDTRSWPWVRDNLWQPISSAEFDAAIDAALNREGK